MELAIKQFNMDMINDDSVVVYIGRRNTGKSFLVKDTFYHKRDMPIGTIISGTELQSGYYSKFNPSLFIHFEFTPELVANVSKRQTLVINEQKKEIKNRIPYDFEWKDRVKKGGRNQDISYIIQRKDGWIDRQEYQMSIDKIDKVIDEKDGNYYVSWKEEEVISNIDTRAFLLLDDCLYDNSWTKDVHIKEFFLNGRHKDIMFMITMQYVMGIPPLFRTNIDYVFILREPYVQNRRKIYDNFAGMFPTFEAFCQVMDQCTENYECLVLHCNSKSNKLEDQIFYYKAQKHDHFKVGADEYWRYHQENYQETGEEETNDLENYGKKKKGPKINVVKRV